MSTTVVDDATIEIEIAAGRATDTMTEHDRLTAGRTETGTMTEATGDETIRVTRMLGVVIAHRVLVAEVDVETVLLDEHLLVRMASLTAPRFVTYIIFIMVPKADLI
jgi:hypothetical protein